MDVQGGCFLVKMYMKTKEMGPIGGRAPENFVCRSANVYGAGLKILEGLLTWVLIQWILVDFHSYLQTTNQ